MGIHRNVKMASMLWICIFLIITSFGSAQTILTSTNSISPECIEESKAWTACILSYPDCLLPGQQCMEVESSDTANGGDGGDGGEINCEIIPELCVGVSCCGECHVLGLELVNCEATARVCSNQCIIPTTLPSQAPTLSQSPSGEPSRKPSSIPSGHPTNSSAPSSKPSLVPSFKPSMTPSSSPSAVPSNSPSSAPSKSPSASPSNAPSKSPSISTASPTVSTPSPTILTPPPIDARDPDVETDGPTATPPLTSDFRCGKSSQDAKDSCGTLCTYDSDCPPDELCFGSWNNCYAFDVPSIAPPIGLPPHIQAKSDYRCGVTEADARSNCKNECLTDIDCDNTANERCWTTRINYCHLMPPNHPQCDHNRVEDTTRRCGFDEMAARGMCGLTCNSDRDCWEPGELCFPVAENLCECFEEQDVLDQVTPDIDGLPTDDTFRGRDLVILRDLNVQFASNRAYFEEAKKPLKDFYAPYTYDAMVGTMTTDTDAATIGNVISGRNSEAAAQEQNGASSASTMVGEIFFVVGSTVFFIIVSHLSI